MTNAIFSKIARALSVDETELDKWSLGSVDAGPSQFSDWDSLSHILAAYAHNSGAKVIGISGSQGSGKSTLAKTLVDALCTRTEIDHAATVSLDDFYLTRAARQELARQVHPLLATRGVPGTHDHVWLQKMLTQIAAGQALIEVPVFDKATDDRAGVQAVQAHAWVLEGWCLGVNAQPEVSLEQPINELEAHEDVDGRWRNWVNEQTRLFYEPLWSNVDFWVHLRVPSFAQVLAWRTEQEQAIAPSQRMDAKALARFIAHYERLTRALWRQPPRAPGICVNLDAHHTVTDVTKLS